MEQKEFDNKLALEVVARFVGNSGRQNSIKRLRQEAFVDGALWAKKYLEDDAPSPAKAEQEGPRWVYYGDQKPIEIGWYPLKDCDCANGFYWWNGKEFESSRNIPDHALWLYDPSTTPPVKEVEPGSDVENTWNTFWKDIVCNPDGTVRMEQVKKELHDFHYVMGEVPKVYCHVTGDRLSKIMYPAETVIGVADEHLQEIVDRELKDQNEDQEINKQSIEAAPVKEAGQPALQVLKNFSVADIDAPTFTHTAEFRQHFDYIKQKLMEVLKEQPAPSGLRWIRITTKASLPSSDILNSQKKYITRGEIDLNGRKHLEVKYLTAEEIDEDCQGFDWYEYLSDSPAPVQVDPESFAKFVSSNYQYDFEAIDPFLPLNERKYRRYWVNGNGDEIPFDTILSAYTQSLQNKP